MAFTRIANNSEQEAIDGVKRTRIYTKPIWLNDNGSWVGKKNVDLTGNDNRISLPGGNWIESKNSLARFLIGKNADTRFNLDIKMETNAGSSSNYSLDTENRNITLETTDLIDIEWTYSHRDGPTVYPSVFKAMLKNNNIQFQFTAPTADTYRLFLQVTPVIGGVASSQLMTNKLGQVYGSEWSLDTGEKLYFTYPSMAGQINEVETNLLGNTLFLYSQDFSLNATEGFILG